MTLENEAYKQGAVPEGYVPVEIDFFQFKEPGQKFEGRIISKDTATFGNTKVGKYILSGKDNKRTTIIGSTHLDDLLKFVPTGVNIIIIYDHEEEIDKDKKMKRFKVFVKQGG